MGRIKLSPSSATRWINCTASPRLESKMPYTRSVYADEGTLAHTIVEFKLRRWLDQITEGRLAEALSNAEQQDLYRAEMLLHAETYLTFVQEESFKLVKQGFKPEIYAEQKLDYSDIVGDGRGILDTVIVTPEVLHVIDYKYGKGVAVYAENNDQLRIYGLAALGTYGLLHDIKEVHLSIVQPRKEYIGTEVLTVDELWDYAEKIVIPAAKAARTTKGQFKAGDWCRFCKVKATCRAFSEHVNEQAKKAFADPEELTEKELIEVHELLPKLTSWAKDVENYLVNKALDGQTPKGYKLVYSGGRRSWIDSEAAADHLRGKGYLDGQILNPGKLKGITDIAGLMAKDDFKAIEKQFVTKSKGKPTLVKKDHPGQEIGDVNDLAKKVFSQNM